MKMPKGNLRSLVITARASQWEVNDEQIGGSGKRAVIGGNIGTVDQSCKESSRKGCQKKGSNNTHPGRPNWQ